MFSELIVYKPVRGRIESTGACFFHFLPPLPAFFVSFLLQPAEAASFSQTEAIRFPLPFERKLIARTTYFCIL